MDIDNINDFIEIENRIDRAEDDAYMALGESIRARWEFGKLVLQYRQGKKLPNGLLDELVEAIGKSRQEIQFRVQFAERCPTEDELSNALDNCESWRDVIRRLPRASKKKEPAPPKYHPKHEEVVDLSAQGLTYEGIAQTTGVGERQVRHIVEREHIEQAAKADATTINLETLPGTMKDKAEKMRSQIRRELEAEFDARVREATQEAVAQRVEKIILETEWTSANARRVLDARQGIFTRADYDTIRSCLHPDSRLSVSDEKLAQAFRLFNEAAIVLLDEKDFPTTTLPSLEELRKRRAQ